MRYPNATIAVRPLPSIDNRTLRRLLHEATVSRWRSSVVVNAKKKE